MLIGIYWLGLFIFIIVKYVIALKSNNIQNYKELLKLEGLSFGSVLLYELIYYICDRTGSLIIITIVLLGVLFGILFALEFLITFITEKVRINKLVDSEVKNNIFKYIFISFAGVTILCVSFPIHEIYNRRSDFNKYVKSYLVNKYGDGNFKMRSVNDQRNYLFYRSNTYVYSVSSSYITKPFEVEMDINTKKIDSDSFLNTYSIEKNLCNGGGINNCIEDYVTDSFNKKVSYPNVYSANLSVNLNGVDTKNFGKIPEVKDLAEYSSIEFLYYTFEKHFDDISEEEFKEYAKALYKDYFDLFFKYNKRDDRTRTIRYRFRYGNPYNTENVKKYIYDGYIVIGDTGLKIYNNEKPVFISYSEIK